MTKEQLMVMNRTKIKPYIDICNNKQGEPFKILIIGNSITYHGVSEKIGWNHKSGMAASDINNDFAHIIFKKTEKLMPTKKICMRISNLAGFERNFPTYNFKLLDNLANYNPDIIIFQLGENTSFDKLKTPILFESKYIDLINYIKKDKHPVIICTTPFFPSLEKNEIIEQVAIKTKSYLADLSHLTLLDKENYVKNEINYQGNKSDWKVSGIGVHPGDYGMKNIARQIFILL